MPLVSKSDGLSVVGVKDLLRWKEVDNFSNMVVDKQL